MANLCNQCNAPQKLLLMKKLSTNCAVRVKLMLGNIEEIRDYHKHVMLPRMEKAVDNAALMR